MKILFNLLLAGLLPLCLFGQLETDNDKDGMDDTWEIQQQLNPNDPTDAWCDLDGDQVLNIFEFQLESNPRDATSPSVRLLTSSTTQKEFIDLAHESTREPLLLKLAAGTYNIGFYRSILPESVEKYKPLKLMVQGGWNSDYSEYNPFVYRTVLDGQNDKDRTFRISTPYNIRQILGETESMVFDGLEFTRGGIQTTNIHYNTSYSVYNCSFYGNESSFYFNTLGAFFPTNIYLANSTFANNIDEGSIRIFSSNAAVDVNMINCTVTNNGTNKGCSDPSSPCPDEVTEAIFTYSANPDDATFNIVNSIMWEEGAYYSINTYQQQFYGPNLSPKKFNFSNSNVPSINQNVNTKIENFENLTYVNPMFSNLSGPHLDLSSNSPLKEVGIDVGLPFAGSAPDLGVNKFVVSGSCRVNEGSPPNTLTEQVFPPVFKDFPWLNNFVNPNDCSTEKIEIYQSGVYTYLLVSDANGTATLYNQNGLFYCQNSNNYDCVSAYRLGSPIGSWTCQGGSTGTLEDTTENTPEDDCSVEDPFSLPFIKKALTSNGVYTTNSTYVEVCLFVEEIVQIEYEGRTYFRMKESVNTEVVCPVQVDDLKFFDCKGDFIGGIGDLPPCESPEFCNTLAEAPGTVIFSFVPSAASSSDNSVFTTFPWLYDVFNPNNCTVEEVEVYEVGSISYVFVRTGSLTGQIYLGDGTLYCASTTSNDCVVPYTYNDFRTYWNCRESSNNPIRSRTAFASSTSTVRAFPNPTTGNLTIQLPRGDAEQHVKVVNMLGNTVFEQITSDANTLSVDLSKYEDGLYFVEWSNGVQYQTKKVLKQSVR